MILSHTIWIFIQLSGVILLMLMLASGLSASPMVEDTNEEPAQLTQAEAIVPPPTTTETPPTATQNCTTARNESGACVMRQSCDYGTPAIDFTLYAPHAYIRPCTEEEVCCPFDFIIQVTESERPSNDGDFEFGDDD